MKLVFYIIVLKACWQVILAEETYTKVDKTENLFVGNSFWNHSKKFFQKIDTFFVNDSSLACSDWYVQILFNVLNDKNQEIPAKGYLIERGGISNLQDVRSCSVFKR
jgi:hypothetical protein